MSEVALELEGVDVAYGACVANRGARLRVRRGEIHALVGENGAGKSTLMKVAFGATRAQAGRLRIGGADVPLARHAPAGAIARGVGMVHQHFMLAPRLSVAENVVLGREPVRRVLGFPVIDRAAAAKAVESFAGRLGLSAAPDTPIERLSVGEQQRVEILKVLWRGADVLLLDEPTAVLGPAEAKELYAVLRGLAGEGKTIVLVTHKLDEVAAVADAITVMRRGEVVAELPKGAPPSQIAKAMIGHDVGPAPEWTAGVAGPTAIEARGLVVARGRGLPNAVDGVELRVGAGEVLGIAGVEGNGQHELGLAIAGLVAPLAGSVRIDGELGHIPDDRLARGLIAELSVAENLILGRQRELGGRFGLDPRRIDAHARELAARFDIRPPDPAIPAGALSGGNQQKLVVARELTRPGLRALVAAQPTRGVDLAAATAIHRALLEARDRKCGILLISSDLAELRLLCDTIAVMKGGRLVAMLPRAEATEERLGALMTGAAA